MDLAEHFTNFYETILDDPRISPVHISLYMALLMAYERYDRINPVPIQRIEIMKCAKINAMSTYYKVIRELEAFGYLLYEPSMNTYSSSIIYLKKI